MNKAFHLFSIILIYLLSTTNISVYGQNKYEENIKIADALVAKQQFLDAAKHYSSAFQSNKNLGSAEDRYKAARSWALAGIPDSAFYQLDKSVTANYNNVSQISADQAFRSLAKDPRWKKVLKSVRENQMVIEQFLSYVDVAEKHMTDSSYNEAAKMFSKAFQFKPNYASNRYMYLYAICLANSGKVNSALSALSKISKNGYKNYLDLSTETAFFELHGDERWRKIIEHVKLNSESIPPRVVGHTSDNNLARNTDLTRALDTILKDDQVYRMQYESVKLKYGTNSVEFRELEKSIRNNDSVNISKVNAILDRHGWPSKEEIGVKGCNTLFLVIQHSDVNIQLKYLDMIKEAVKQGSLQKSQLAILEDRIAVNQGKPQVYGSQLAINKKTGNYYVQRLVNPNLVDVKRAEVGLPSMEIYLRTWKMTWSLERYFKDLADIKDLDNK